MIRLKRAYEAPKEEDGYRVLIDRLWPRGKKKEEEKIDEWPKELAPSTELRKWFNHEPEKFEEFKEKYQKELFANKAAEQKLKELAKKSETETVTLIYSAKDETNNNAVVLAEILKTKFSAKIESK